MIKAEAYKDGEGYWVEIVDFGVQFSMQDAEALKYQLEAILYEYDCMIDAHTNVNYPEDA